MNQISDSEHTAPVDTSVAVQASRKAALASWIGSALEYYDFFIYGTAAALVFGKLFYPNHDPKIASMAALATFGVAYITRPVGAFILGHVGDRYGRKRVLTFTLLLMGVSTFLVGLLPTYEEIGVAAPLMLVLLRLLQGFSAAGEQAGANSMTLEHAPAQRRGFYSSFTLSGTQAGLILATLVFIPVSALPEADLLRWGWRIPFLLSAVVVIVGLWLRRSLPEAPRFANPHTMKSQTPLIELFQDYRTQVLRIIFAALVSVVSTIFSVFTLSYAVNTLHMPRTTMLSVLVAANLVALAARPCWAMLSDRIGRRPVFMFGALGCGLLIWPYLWAISTQNIPLIFALGILLSGITYSAANGVWPSLYGEMFSTRVRLSGMAIGTQIGFALGGFAPSISAALITDGVNGWMPVAVFTSTAMLVSAVAVWSARETSHLSMAQLDATVTASH